MLDGPKGATKERIFFFFWNISRYNVLKPELDFEESVFFIDGCQSWVRFCIRTMDHIAPNMLARLVRFGLVVYNCKNLSPIARRNFIALMELEIWSSPTFKLKWG